MTALLPFSLAVFLGFLAIGLPLPVLPLLVHDGFGFGTVAVGLVIGAQSMATLLTRPIRRTAVRSARHQADNAARLLCGRRWRGGLYLASTLGLAPGMALGVRPGSPGGVVLGFGESLFITAIAAWSVARVGPSARRPARSPGRGSRCMRRWRSVPPWVAGWSKGFGFVSLALLVVACPLMGAAMTLGLPSIEVVAGPASILPIGCARDLDARSRRWPWLRRASEQSQRSLPCDTRWQAGPIPGSPWPASDAPISACGWFWAGLPDRIGGPAGGDTVFTRADRWANC